jgi:hypothetical protein
LRNPVSYIFQKHVISNLPETRLGMKSITSSQPTNNPGGPSRSEDQPEKPSPAGRELVRSKPSRNQKSAEPRAQEGKRKSRKHDSNPTSDSEPDDEAEPRSQEGKQKSRKNKSNPTPVREHDESEPRQNSQKKVDKGKGRAAPAQEDDDGENDGEKEVPEEEEEDEDDQTPGKLMIYKRTRSHSRAAEEEEKSAQKNLQDMASRSTKKSRPLVHVKQTPQKVIIDLTGEVSLLTIFLKQ